VIGYDGSAYVVGVVSALWLGILTSISPCPLATNIAAISYIGRRVGSPRQVLLSGMLYALGRSLAYLALGMLLVASVLSIPQLSLFLQKYMNKLLGPILIVVAMFLLGLIQLNITGPGVSDTMQKRVDALGMWGALVLGILFALTFCPVSAALFFGSLIPLSVKVRLRRRLAGCLRDWHGLAGPGIRGAHRAQCQVGRQGVQCDFPNRMVGPTSHGRSVSYRGRLLRAEVRVRCDVTGS